MANPLIPRATTASTSLALLLLRVTTGVALGLHGVGKLSNLTGWDQGTSGMPAALLPLAAISEGIGGWLLALGFLTPIAAFGALCTMGGAVWFHANRGDVFAATGPNMVAWELPASFLAASFAILVLGAGSLSVDKVVFRPRKS